MKKTFMEYLSTKGVVQKKADVKVVADKVDLPSGRDKKPPRLRVWSAVSNLMSPRTAA